MRHRKQAKSIYFEGRRVFSLLFAFLLAGAATGFAQTDPERSKSANFKRCWDVAVALRPVAGIAADGVRGYYADNSGKVHAVDIQTGEVAWSTEVGGNVLSNLVVSGSSIYLIGGGNGKSTFANALSTLTGLQVWRTELPASEVYFLHHGANGIAVVSSEGDIHNLQTATGNKTWKISVPGGVAIAPQFGDDRVVIASRENRIEVVSLANGDRLAAHQLKFAPAAVGAGNEDTIVYADGKGAIFAADISGGQKWRFRAGGRIEHVVSVGSRILVGSADNFVYYLSLDRGNLYWKRRLSGRVASSGLIGNERAAFTVFGERSAWVMELDDGRVVDQVTLGNDDAFLLTPVKANGRYLLAATINGISGYSPQCDKEKAVN